jgi:hypothetical protein
MLAYHVEWHMRRDLAPILFDDHDRDAARAARTSIVAPAAISGRARAKKQTLRTEDGLPVQSFQSLLAHLATLTRNRVRAWDFNVHLGRGKHTRPCVGVHCHG